MSIYPSVEVYLAGLISNVMGKKNPIEEKRTIIEASGMKLSPALLEALNSTFSEPVESFEQRMAQAREVAMLESSQPSKRTVVLVNLSPRKDAIDTGAAFEAGFMSALASINKEGLIIGYYETVGDGPAASTNAAPPEVDPMIRNAIDKSGGRICDSFEEAVSAAKDIMEKPRQPRYLPMRGNWSSAVSKDGLATAAPMGDVKRR